MNYTSAFVRHLSTASHPAPAPEKYGWRAKLSLGEAICIPSSFRRGTTTPTPNLPPPSRSTLQTPLPPPLKLGSERFYPGNCFSSHIYISRHIRAVTVLLKFMGFRPSGLSYWFILIFSLFMMVCSLYIFYIILSIKTITFTFNSFYFV